MIVFVHIKYITKVEHQRRNSRYQAWKSNEQWPVFIIQGKRFYKLKNTIYLKQADVQLIFVLHIIHHYFVPQVAAIFNKFFVDGIILVSLLSFKVVKEHQLGNMVAVLHHISFPGAGWNAYIKLSDSFDFFQRSKSGLKSLQVFF